MVICLERGADLHMAQLMPLPLTVSCFSKIQIGFTFLVPAHPGSPGQRAVKRVCVCVSVSASTCACQYFRRYVVGSAHKRVSEVALMTQTPSHQRLHYVTASSSSHRISPLNMTSRHCCILILIILTMLVHGGGQVVLRPAAIRLHRALSLMTTCQTDTQIDIHTSHTDRHTDRHTYFTHRQTDRYTHFTHRQTDTQTDIHTSHTDRHTHTDRYTYFTHRQTYILHTDKQTHRQIYILHRQTDTHTDR